MSRRSPLLAVAASMAALACGSDAGNTAPPASSSSAPPVASVAPSASAAPSASFTTPLGEPPVDDENRGKRRKFGDAAVFLDGVPKGVLRVRELPPTLPRRDATLVDGRVVARWRVAEYLQLLGVDLAKLREIHVLGGRGRTSIIPGAEVRRLQDKLLFSFTRGATGGKPRFHWPPGIQSNTTIDIVGAVCAYVDKPPPIYDKEERALYTADHTKFEGIPYLAPEASPKGTRVYRDGVYLGAVKKKLLGDALLAADATPAEPRFSLEKYLLSVGVDPSKSKAVDLVDGDALAVRIEPALWEKIRGRTTFAVGTGSRGRASLRVSEPPPGFPAEIFVSALLVHAAGPVPRLPAEQVEAKDRAGLREPQVDSPMP